MPRLYPGLLKDKEVEMIAQYLRTIVFQCDTTELQTAFATDVRGDNGVASHLLRVDLAEMYQLSPGEFPQPAPLPTYCG